MSSRGARSTVDPASPSSRYDDRDIESDEEEQSEGETPEHSNIEEESELFKGEEVYPIQLYFEGIRYSVPIEKKKEKKELFWRRKKKPATESRPNDVEKAELESQRRERVGEVDVTTAKPGKDKPMRSLLNGIDGFVNPGTLLAIMGSSGAGKTTLLNVLANRVGGRGKLEGKILLNGHTWNEAKPIRKHVAYILQDDILLRTQTPRESLAVSAKLRIPQSVMKTDEERYARVDKLIDELGLSKCRSTQIGAPGIRRGISGGERKRVSIGNELVTNPSLLFVDEPTSGLDSFTALSVMKLLRRVAKSGRTVVCTIHQPNSLIFALFDQLMLLSNGQVVYYGPASRVRHYFSQQGYPCPRYVNPADFYVELINVDPTHEESKRKVDRMIEYYKGSDLYQKQRQEAQVQFVPIEKPKSRREERKQEYARSFGIQVKVLLARSFKDTLREPLKTKAAFFQTIFISLIIGLIFLNIGNSQADIQNRLGALFFVVVNQAFSSLGSIVNLFPSEKALFFREHGNNMYSATAFYLSRVLADLPNQIIFPIIFATIVYWMIGFKATFMAFLIFVAVVILVANIGAAIGMFLGIIAKDAGTATALQPLFLLPFMIFSGFFVNSETVPVYFVWIEYISFIRYAFAILVINEFEDLTFQCESNEYIATPQGDICPVTSGNQTIENLSFDDDTIYIDFIILAGIYLFFRIASWLVLLWKARRTINA